MLILNSICSTNVLMFPKYEKSKRILKISELNDLPKKSIVSIVGILIIKQRPSTANGVTFLSLEDETGVANVVFWNDVYEKYKYIILPGNLLKINGFLDKQGLIINLIAREAKNLSYLYKELESI